ncbi:MAG TPA: choice-of-anchor Q domain-containing protein, partial [Anaerolineales bacterium]|nr:choice-of-anchor Q domain-containing protein [Anaerolineales bacterium]
MDTKSIKTLVINLLCPLAVVLMLGGMLGFLPTGSVYAVGSTVFVKADASGANNGSSWEDAYTSLQDALSASVSGDQIWVAAGTYYPTAGTDQSATFALQDGVSIYGGFAGTEISLTERNPVANVTILSGDIGTPANMDDNSYHVVTGSDTNSTAVLDGFMITSGNALDDPLKPWGGGLFNETGSPTLANLVISGNTASYGGGMYNYNSSPTITNTTFSSNSAQERAGGMYNIQGSNSILRNVTFSGNSAATRGGGMTTSTSSPSLTNVTFNENTAQRGGALHNAVAGDPILTHVTFSGNTATVAGGAIYNEDSNPIITNSILYNNSGGEIHDVDSTPVVTHSIVEGGYTGTGNFDQDPLLGSLQNNGGLTETMALGVGSPAIDAGNDANCPDTDQRGVTRPQGIHCDIGAYEAPVPPGLTSFTCQSPATSPTNANTLVFRATFNEAVMNVDTGDFVVNGSTATVTNVATVNASTYDVTVSGGNLASFNGVVGLNLSGAQNITDLDANALLSNEP